MFLHNYPGFKGAYFKLRSFGSTRERLGFTVLKGRLVSHITARMNNGDFTERGLARSVGVSQAHMHNILNGTRKLTGDLADRLLAYFDLSVVDLMDASEIAGASGWNELSPDAAMAEAHRHLAMMRQGEIPRKGLSRESRAGVEQVRFRWSEQS